MIINILVHLVQQHNQENNDGRDNWQVFVHITGVHGFRTKRETSAREFGSWELIFVGAHNQLVTRPTREVIGLIYLVPHTKMEQPEVSWRLSLTLSEGGPVNLGHGSALWDLHLHSPTSRKPRAERCIFTFAPSLFVCDM